MEETNIRANADLELSQHETGFSFGTDALLLSAFVRALPKETAVELGSGSGAIALLTLKRNRFARVIGVEIQAPYRDVMQKNACQNDLQDRLLPLIADARTVTAETVGGEVGAVFANPPYYALEAGRAGKESVREAARREVFGGIRDFCACASRLLRFGGVFSVVYCPQRLTDLLCEMRNANLEPKRVVLVRKDEAHPPFAVLAEGKKGAKSFCQTEVFTLFDTEGNPTPAYEKLQSEGVWSL